MLHCGQPTCRVMSSQNAVNILTFTLRTAPSSRRNWRADIGAGRALSRESEFKSRCKLEMMIRFKNDGYHEYQQWYWVHFINVLTWFAKYSRLCFGFQWIYTELSVPWHVHIWIFVRCIVYKKYRLHIYLRIENEMAIWRLLTCQNFQMHCGMKKVHYRIAERS